MFEKLSWTVSNGHQFWSLEIYFVSLKKKQGVIFEILKILILKNLKFRYYLDNKEIKPFDAVIASQRSQNDEESFPFDLCEWPCEHDRSKVLWSDRLTVGILKMSMAQLILDTSNLPAGCNGNMEIKHMIDGAWGKEVWLSYEFGNRIELFSVFGRISLL